MEEKLSRCAQCLQTSRPEPSSPADPNSESLGHPALFLLTVQIKWQNAQPPPALPKTPAAAQQHPELQPAGDTPVPSLCGVTYAGCSYCCPCRRVSEPLCVR